MKTKLFFISIAIVSIVFVIIIGSCKKEKDTEKTGQIIFSMTTTYGDCSVTINGETKTFDSYLDNPPACGTISTKCANFSLPVGTYTFEFKYNDGSGPDVDYPGSHSATITDGGCVSVRW